MRPVIATAVTWALILSACITPGHAASAQSQDVKPTVQEAILAIPDNSPIEVRLLNSEKVKGRLGEVGANGFVVKTAKGTVVEDRTIAFADVKSVKQKKEGTSTGRIVLYVLAGVGIVWAALVIIVAATGGFDT